MIMKKCNAKYFFFKMTAYQTTWPNKAKFHMEPDWDWGKKVCSNDPGHMTKMAAMYMYVKKL